jgi:lysozyme family protein
MGDRFAECLPHILHHEGGWADHPKDPGGATMRGITLAVFREWTGKQSTKAELKAISDETVAAIYRKNYWFPSHCDKLPAGVDLIVFDLAVNSGPGRARKFLQEAVGAEPDGVIGAKTLAAVAALPPREVILRLRNRRERFYRGLATFATFGKGWMRRLSEVAVAADRMTK